MQLTKRGEYALRALIQLGVAQEPGRELVSVSELAHATAQGASNQFPFVPSATVAAPIARRLSCPAP